MTDLDLFAMLMFHLVVYTYSIQRLDNEEFGSVSVLVDSRSKGDNVYNYTTTTKWSANNNINNTKAFKNKNESKKYSIFAMVGLGMIVISGIKLYSIVMGGNLEKISESNGDYEGIDCIYRCLINHNYSLVQNKAI